MPIGLREQLRAAREKTAAAIAERNAQLSHGIEALEAKGHEVYADTIRKGQAVLARTPAEVRALGLAAVQGRLPQAVGQAVAKEVIKRASQQGPSAVKSSASVPKASPQKEPHQQNSRAEAAKR